eukprot:TRINITY_DN63627_c0_g1_i1.p1 TRINITY_DN63627_c0_g1~~TRINITY_DN63627_c0_g1_i1.p1  ORF type:complete len:358 (-),score=42.63 TRINITY_DN63627_c0_g1_i1:443-1516(-)
MASNDLQAPFLGNARGKVRLKEFLAERLPGVALAYLVAACASACSSRFFGGAFPPLLWSAILGIACGNLWTIPEPCKAGVAFSKARLLRLGIILYGFKLSAGQIAGIGLAGLFLDFFILLSTLTLGYYVGTRILGLNPEPVLLITTGASVCGCSAVLAAQPVVKAKPHEVTAAIGTVVLCGTTSMFLYPFLHSQIPSLSESPNFMGIYTGATVHELAGVVAAGNAMGPEIAATAVITKLTRVLCLAPFLLLIQKLLPAKDGSRTSSLQMPWFAFGFVAVVGLSSVCTVPKVLTSKSVDASTLCLSMAMAGLGMETSIRRVLDLGSKPVALALILFLHLMVSGYGAAKLLADAGLIVG